MAAEQAMSLDLHVDLDPVGRHLGVHALLTGAVKFLLNSHLSVDRCRSGVLGVPWHDEPAPSPFAEVARLVVLDGEISPESTVVELDYSGTLPLEMTDGVNVVGPEVVELSVYSCWFPVPPDLRAFDWHMTLTLPNRWSSVTNGRRGDASGEWQSFPHASIGDIVIVASPAMQTHTVAPGCGLVCAGDMADGVQARTAMIGDALDLLGRWYGPLGSDLQHNVVVTHRSGFAYSRMPTIFLPSQVAATVERDQQTLFHEISHFWWNLASVASFDDWLNESLAEYSSLRLMGALIGPGTAQAALERRRQCASTSRGDPAMRATNLGDDKSGYANKYARGALFHEECARRLGREAHDDVLRRLYAGHVRGPQLTMRNLVDAISEMDAEVGLEAVRVLAVPSWDGRWPRVDTHRR